MIGFWWVLGSGLGRVWQVWAIDRLGCGISDLNIKKDPKQK